MATKRKPKKQGPHRRPAGDHYGKAGVAMSELEELEQRLIDEAVLREYMPKWAIAYLWLLAQSRVGAASDRARADQEGFERLTKMLPGWADEDYA